MDANGHLLESLSRSEMFQDYERAFAETTGLPITLCHVETWQLPLHGKRHENPFCALLAANSTTCASCLQMQAKLTQSAAQGRCTLTCAYGLSETAVPVKLGMQTIGFLQTGQVLRQPPTAAMFRRAVATAEELGVDLDTARAKAAYFASPVVPPRKIASAATLLAIFADHLSLKSNQIAVQTIHAEPPVVAKARQFIREHYTEELSLGRVAAAVHTSLYNLCKLFRKTTGTTFTEFVARTRIEHAKNLLLNLQLRVSEVAFEVGFQSLTHFNRVFKKLVGESPGAYRGHLPRGVLPPRRASERLPEPKRQWQPRLTP